MCIGKVGVRAIATKCSSDVQAVYRNISCSSTSNTVADGNTEPAVQQTHQKHSARKLTETGAPETFIHRSTLCSCVSPHTHVEIDLSPANARLLPVGAKCALFRTAPIAVERCYNMSSQSSCEFSQEWKILALLSSPFTRTLARLRWNASLSSPAWKTIGRGRQS